MAIKRGVSLYSYQQAQFFGKMNWKDQIVEVHDHLKTDGIEIIDEATIRDYPFPSEQFIYDWNNFMARYGNDGHLSGCASVPGSYHDSSGSGGTFEK